MQSYCQKAWHYYNEHEEIKGKASVWGKENNFKEPLIKGSWKDIKNFYID